MGHLLATLVVSTDRIDSSKNFPKKTTAEDDLNNIMPKSEKMPMDSLIRTSLKTCLRDVISLTEDLAFESLRYGN